VRRGTWSVGREAGSSDQRAVSGEQWSPLPPGEGEGEGEGPPSPFRDARLLDPLGRPAGRMLVAYWFVPRPLRRDQQGHRARRGFSSPSPSGEG